jgi:hypothetical protein
VITPAVIPFTAAPRSNECDDEYFSMLRDAFGNPFLFGHGLVRHNVVDVRIVCVNRLQRLPIATIKQRARQPKFAQQLALLDRTLFALAF